MKLARAYSYLLSLEASNEPEENINWYRAILDGETVSQLEKERAASQAAPKKIKRTNNGKPNKK
jgi:hypothetical protein